MKTESRKTANSNKLQVQQNSREIRWIQHQIVIKPILQHSSRTHQTPSIKVFQGFPVANTNVKIFQLNYQFNTCSANKLVYTHKPVTVSDNKLQGQWSRQQIKSAVIELHCQITRRAQYVIHLRRPSHITCKTFNHNENYGYWVLCDSSERVMSEQWWKVCGSQRVSMWWARVIRSSLHCHYCVHALSSSSACT